MKYSIIIPVYNAKTYISATIDSILKINYSDFELLVSDNCSNDGTSEILSNYNDIRLRIIRPASSLSMSEHWDFAIKNAQGNWVIAVGADDSLQPYFFDYCDFLTSICEKNDLKIIKSSRAYYFYNGLQDLYGNNHISYMAKPVIKICSTKKIMKDALCVGNKYFDTPQMYTTSLFKRQLIEKVISHSKTNSVIPPLSPCQDSYLSVIACTCEDNYLYTEIPIGWVGSSPKSIGYRSVKGENMSNSLSYNENENFLLACNQFKNCIFIMKKAFEEFFNDTSIICKDYNFYLSKYILFSHIYIEEFINKKADEELKKIFFQIKSNYKINMFILYIVISCLLIKRKILNPVTRVHNKIKRIINRLKKYEGNNCYSFSYDFDNFMTYCEINDKIKKDKRILELLDSVQNSLQSVKEN